MGPASLTATLMTSPATGEQHVIVTLHTPQGTSWGKMTREQLDAAIGVLAGKRDKMTALVLPGSGHPNGGRT
jgi:hypothetical protein